MYIFNGEIIQDWNDSYVIFTTRFLVVGWSSLSMVYERKVNNWGRGHGFLVLTGQLQEAESGPKTHSLIPLGLTMLLLFFVVVFVQGKIEWIKYKSWRQTEALEEKAEHRSIYLNIQSHIQNVRTSSTITITVIFLLLFW